MGINIIDTRKNDRHKHSENRQRFLKRIKATIKDQLPKILGERSLKDLTTGGGQVKVKRNQKTIHEPSIHYGSGGVIDRVLPGNDSWVTGDKISKPRNGSGSGGRQASNNAEDGEDDFEVELTREEFLDAFFEDLELPNLIKTELSKLTEVKRVNAGFQPDGAANRLNLQRSYERSLARRIALTRGVNRRIEELELTMDGLAGEELTAADLELAALRSKKKPPLFEEMDLRYRLSLTKEIPVTHATMILVMDNSGSMGPREKTIARKFFYLLYKFLERTYEDVDLRFISHTTTAVEMTEEQFFNTHISGGTVVSSALEMVNDIIQKDLAGKTNVYVAQVSDGDNYDDDNDGCAELLSNHILPDSRYYAYLQIEPDCEGSINMSHRSSSLWNTYESVANQHQQLKAVKAFSEADIFKAFRSLFEKTIK